MGGAHHGGAGAIRGPLADVHDVLILGGGTAGCVLAARLSEDPSRSVCLVEAGPDYGAQGGGGWPAELLDGRVGPDTHDWRHESDVLMVARVIGGVLGPQPLFLDPPGGSRLGRVGAGERRQWLGGTPPCAGTSSASSR